MSMLEKVGSLRTRVLAILKKLEPVALLLVRLTVGVVFLQTGWGHLSHFDDTVDAFTGWGVPMPHLNALMASYTELIGGGLVLVGLFSRLAAVPLSFTMIVAILTAKKNDIHGVADLLGTDEFAYLVFFLVVALVGPGKLSLDTIVAHFLEPKKKDTKAPAVAAAA
jgi:putative oxidoreductase